MKKTFYLCIAFFLSAAGLASAQTPQLALTPFSTGFSQPIGIFNAGDSRLFVIEQQGRIIIVNNQGIKNTTPFLDISSVVGSSGTEQGLLGLAFHPDYATNGYFFVNYTDLQGNTVVARFQVSANPDIADAGTGTTLLTINQPFSNHNGGNIMFGPDGYLYIGMGDGGSGGDPQGHGQNRQSLLGKMLRIDINTIPYSIPTSNPFVNSTTTKGEIWGIGLRNPWRFSFDRITGDMWIADVGQNSWEEINFEPAWSGGHNYGWRCYEGNNTFNTGGCDPQSAMTFPVSTYENNSTNGCSVTGGFVYRGGKYGRLYGHYLFTDYCSGKFRSIIPNGSGGFTTTQLQQFLQYQYSTFGEDKYGELYVAGRANGNIYKIEETTCEPTAVILGDPWQPFGITLNAVHGESNTYQWYLNGQALPSSDSSSLNTLTHGLGYYYVAVTNPNNCTSISDSVQIYPVSAEEDLPIRSLNLYPNPATNNFSVAFSLEKAGTISTEIFNTLGQKVYSSQILLNQGEQQLPISMPSAAKGMYLLRLTSPYGMATTRFVIE